MRHIYSGGGETGEFPDRDEAWNHCLDMEEPGPRPARWVNLPENMCVDPT